MILINKGIEKYIIYDTSTKQCIGIDRNSGGYPFHTKDFQSIELFKSQTDAQDYIDIIKGMNTGTPSTWVVKTIEIRIKSI